jgi:adenylate kinase family enzyme
MLIAIIGENCVGKSTLADKLTECFHAKIFSGRDFLRLEKNPFAATETFKAMLEAAVTGENIIYLITEQEHLALLPEGAVRIVLTEELEVIKARFRERMRGNLPQPLEKMLEAKHGMYDALPCDLRLNAGYSMGEVLEKLKTL